MESRLPNSQRRPWLGTGLARGQGALLVAVWFGLSAAAMASSAAGAQGGSRPAAVSVAASAAPGASANASPNASPNTSPNTSPPAPSTSLAMPPTLAEPAVPARPDPLHSAPCVQARQALAAYEAELARQPPAAGRTASNAASAPPTIPPRLRALRNQVASACLATTMDAPAPQRQVQPPISVPPVTSPAAPPAPLPMPGVQPAPGAVPSMSSRANPGPVPQRPLRSITSCDAAGCWTSDGTRLQRMGPTLVGPQGACQVSGAVVSCP